MEALVDPRSLGALRTGAFGDENPADWAKYGLTAKSRQVGLADRDGKELARLTLGGEVEGKPGFIYVRGTRRRCSRPTPRG